MACNKDETAAFSTSDFQQSPPFSDSNGQVHNFQNTAHPAFPAQYIPTPSPPFFNSNCPSRNPMTSSTSFFRPDTFWTLCNRCVTYSMSTQTYSSIRLFFATAVISPFLRQLYLYRAAVHALVPSQMKNNKICTLLHNHQLQEPLKLLHPVHLRSMLKGYVKMAKSVMITMKGAKG